MKKYELTKECKIFGNGRKIFRIRALRDFSNVKAGDLGGWIEKEENLSHEGAAWVSGNAVVSGYARISENAVVSGYARVSEYACVFGYAEISEYACVFGYARVSGFACVFGYAEISENARISENAKVYKNNHYTTIKGFGTNCRNTTFFRCKDKKIRVNCGCFCGTIDEFRERVKNTREGKIAKEYLMIADLMEYHFSNAE